MGRAAVCDDCFDASDVCAECGFRDLWGDCDLEADPDQPHLKYCQPCWSGWGGGEDDVAAAPPAPVSDAANNAAKDAAVNTGRNQRNVARIKAAFPGHCAHHLYFAHLRNTPSRGCSFGEDCRSGRHDAPPGLSNTELEPWW